MLDLQIGSIIMDYPLRSAKLGDNMIFMNFTMLEALTSFNAFDSDHLEK